jgi:hypothetical protein
MKSIYFTLLALLVTTNFLLGQNLYEIEGKIINKETYEPVSYANIYNKSIKKGTISNVDGYFRISVGSVNDTIRITNIGFKEQFIRLEANENFYVIQLEENVLALKEVTVKPKDYSFLIDLISESKKNRSTIPQKSKAVYELKSFVDTKQIELVEAYYNVDFIGYELNKLELKVGRSALKPYINRLFASVESSRAIILLNLFERNEFFPTSPLELSKKNLKKNYYLSLANKYVDEVADSIYVINYKPKDTTRLYFEGTIWINKTQKQLNKIILNCNNAAIYPFTPMFPSDKISKVSMNITQTFKSVENQALFNHTDFTYEIDYSSRVGKSEQKNYKVKTNAILYVYDYENSFFQPLFTFKEKNISDYRKINAMPYNDFFWSSNDEYRLNDSLNTNAQFFSDKHSVNSKFLFKSNPYSKKGLLEHPFVEWSKSRIKFREMVPDSVVINASKNIISLQYNLAVKIFLDINKYKDSTHYLTATIFDPYESYYYLPMDKKTNCFVNIFFDLCEIKRRKLQAQLNSQNISSTKAEEIYMKSINELEILKNDYLKDVQRGTNENEMKKYNEIVFNELGINNIELFKPFEK